MSQSEEAIRREYMGKREQISSIAQKIAELDQDRNEHDLVKKTLTPMAEDRKCFRLIGGVLVERTVGEVRPVITQNLAQIEKLCMTLMEKLKAAEKDAEEFRILHNIVISKEGEAAANAAGQGEGERRGAGVLV